MLRHLVCVSPPGRFFKLTFWKISYVHLAQRLNDTNRSLGKKATGGDNYIAIGMFGNLNNHTHRQREKDTLYYKTWRQNLEEFPDALASISGMNRSFGICICDGENYIAEEWQTREASKKGTIGRSGIMRRPTNLLWHWWICLHDWRVSVCVYTENIVSIGLASLPFFKSLSRRYIYIQYIKSKFDLLPHRATHTHTGRRKFYVYYTKPENIAFTREYAAAVVIHSGWKKKNRCPRQRIPPIRSPQT